VCAEDSAGQDSRGRNRRIRSVLILKANNEGCNSSVCDKVVSRLMAEQQIEVYKVCIAWVFCREQVHLKLADCGVRCK
jgi:hypothetical protein